MSMFTAQLKDCADWFLGDLCPLKLTVVPTNFSTGSTGSKFCRPISTPELLSYHRNIASLWFFSNSIGSPLNTTQTWKFCSSPLRQSCTSLCLPAPSHLHSLSNSPLLLCLSTHWTHRLPVHREVLNLLAILFSELSHKSSKTATHSRLIQIWSENSPFLFSLLILTRPFHPTVVLKICCFKVIFLDFFSVLIFYCLFSLSMTMQCVMSAIKATHK